MTLLNSKKSTLILTIIYSRNIRLRLGSKKANMIKYYFTMYIKSIVDPVIYLGYGHCWRSL